MKAVDLLNLLPGVVSTLTRQKVKVKKATGRNVTWASFTLAIGVVCCGVESFGNDSVSFTECMKEFCSITQGVLGDTSQEDSV